MLSIAQLAFAIPVSVVAIDGLRQFIQGNILSINIEEPWKTYTEWHAIYGNVFYLRLLDQEVIVLGSQPTAVELLEKRSHLYSDRPFIATVVPFGAEFNFAFTPYGDHWRFSRRIFHQTFRADAAVSFRPMQLRRARQLVLNILDDPEPYHSHYTTFATAVALSAAYDYEPSTRNDPIVHILEEWTAASIPASTSERAILLNLFPWLLNIPDWFPGPSLKMEAKRARGLAEKMINMPYQYVMDQMASNEHPINSMVSDHTVRMQQCDESHRADYVQTLKDVASTSILASGETTSSSLMMFTLAMVMHPHVWKRAQAEIDSIVGINRLPDFDDRPSLPYVEAILRETVRWQPVVPLGIWHATSGNDIFNGHYIPKGATVMANIWAMSRDEARFPNAEEFIPERFLTEGGSLNDNDPMDFIFGFGRRICPGRYTADASLWSAMATILATLDLCPPRDAQGNDVAFEVKYVNGITQ